jgi:hypothetical protein
VSLDTRLKLSPTWFFTAQLGRSFTEELDGPRLSGSTYFAELAHESRHVEYFGHYLDFSPDFRSQLGYVKRVDVRQTEHRAKYRWRPESGPFVKFGPSLRTLFNWDRQGRLQDRELELSFDMDLHGKTALELSHSQAYELFEDRGFRKRATGISLSTEWFKWLSISTAYNWGTDVNFDPAPGLDPFLATAAEGELQLTLRPTPRFRFDQTFIYSSLRTNRRSIVPEVPSSSAVFNNPIWRWKVNYQFTRALSLRAIVDYEAVRPNTALVDLEDEKRFAADILLTYLLNPGTALHLGYTDNYENIDLMDTMPRSLRRVRSPFNSTGRQVFFKLSYLWRK